MDTPPDQYLALALFAALCLAAAVAHFSPAKPRSVKRSREADPAFGLGDEPGRRERRRYFGFAD